MYPSLGMFIYLIHFDKHLLKNASYVWNAILGVRFSNGKDSGICSIMWKTKGSFLKKMTFPDFSELTKTSERETYKPMIISQWKISIWIYMKMEEDLMPTYSHEEHQVIKEIWDSLDRSRITEASVVRPRGMTSSRRDRNMLVDLWLMNLKGQIWKHKYQLGFLMEVPRQQYSRGGEKGPKNT